jgi:chaperonin cofactor prefoldin
MAFESTRKELSALSLNSRMPCRLRLKMPLQRVDGFLIKDSSERLEANVEKSIERLESQIKGLEAQIREVKDSLATDKRVRLHCP